MKWLAFVQVSLCISRVRGIGEEKVVTERPRVSHRLFCSLIRRFYHFDVIVEAHSVYRHMIDHSAIAWLADLLAAYTSYRLQQLNPQQLHQFAS